MCKNHKFSVLRLSRGDNSTLMIFYYSYMRPCQRNSSLTMQWIFMKFYKRSCAYPKDIMFECFLQSYGPLLMYHSLIYQHSCQVRGPDSVVDSALNCESGGPGFEPRCCIRNEHEPKPLILTNCKHTVAHVFCYTVLG